MGRNKSETKGHRYILVQALIVLLVFFDIPLTAEYNVLKNGPCFKHFVCTFFTKIQR